MQYFRILPAWMFVPMDYGDASPDRASLAVPAHTFDDWAALIRLPALNPAQEDYLQCLSPVPVTTFEYVDIAEIYYNIHIFSERMRVIATRSEITAHLRFFPVRVLPASEKVAIPEGVSFYAVQYAAPLWIPCLKPVLTYKRKELRLPPSEVVGGSFRKAVYHTGNSLLIVDRELLQGVPFCRVANEYNESLIVREDVLDCWLKYGLEGFDFEEVLID